MKFNRRDFLKVGLLTASAMSFSACGRPVEHGIVSQYQMPEYKVLGQPSFWASTCTDLRSDCAVQDSRLHNCGECYGVRLPFALGLRGHRRRRNSARTLSLLPLTHRPLEN